MAKEKVISVEPLKENIITMDLVGDTDLMLHARSRYYVQCEVWKQSHDKGSEPPAIYKQGKNIWEPLITSIHWEKPIQFHDEDISLYSEEEWKEYIENNRPCILTSAFVKSFKESFITFFKDTTGRAGTDFSRSVNLEGSICPVDFTSARIENSIVPTMGAGNITFFKDTTGRAGTDFSRSVNLEGSICPVDFTSARIENSIVPTMGAGKGAPVLASCNVFSGWKTQITVSCPQIVFPLETLIQIISTTGKYIGIGTQRGNGFGRYHIENVTVLKK